MSVYRTELVPGEKGTPCATGLTAYLLILRAVEAKKGLAHGHLRHQGQSCAIGSFFDLHQGKLALPTTVVDEVASVNDAAPQLSPRARKFHMVKWLQWKLGTLGFLAPTPPPTVPVDAATMATIARQVDAVAAGADQPKA